MKASLIMLCCIGVTALVQQASATLPAPLVQVLPVSPHDVRSNLPDIDIRINTADVSKITIESVITSAADGVVNSARPIEAIIAESAETDFNELGSEAMSASPPELLSARPGDVVTIPSPHLLGLRQGPHVQTITVRVPLPTRPWPLEYTTTRLMDVRADGIHWLGWHEYFDLVAPKVSIPRPDGSLALGIIGQLGPAEPANLKLTQLSDVIRLEANTEGKGNAP